VTGLGDLPAEALRAHLHRVADWIADYRGGLADRRITPQLEPGALRAGFPPTLGDAGTSLEGLLEVVERVIVPGVVQWGHPAFLGYFGSTSTGPGIVAEALAAALNVSAMSWRVSPAAVELEEVVVGWLREMLGLPDAFAGMVYDSASSSTLHALAAAREVAAAGVRCDGMAGARPMTLYASDQAHSSVDKAAVVLGFGERAVRKVASDARFRMDAGALRAAIATDRRAGRLPCAVVATVGTTETAAVDPLPAIAAVCRDEGLWLHVDAAYGGALAILREGRWVLDGVAGADSMVVNPHKWLFVPFDFSVLYSPRFDDLRRVFELTPAYLDGDAHAGGVDPMDVTLQLGRRFRALKAWMVWAWLGRDGLTARLREHRRLARRLAEWVQAEPGFAVCAPVEMSVVCFRAFAGLPPADADAAHERVLARVLDGGDVYLTRTRLHGRVTLRAAITNVLTEEQHLRRAWEAVRAAVAAEADDVQSATG